MINEVWCIVLVTKLNSIDPITVSKGKAWLSNIAKVQNYLNTVYIKMKIVNVLPDQCALMEILDEQL